MILPDVFQRGPMSGMIDYGEGIHAVDACYLRPHVAEVYLIESRGRVAVVDTGTNDSQARVLAARQEMGASPGQVDYILLTHIHLDHAGGAGALMRAFSNARLVVHPRGARHMIDPSRLIAGSVAVYGLDEVRRLYGDVLPVDPMRILEAVDGLRIDLAGRGLRVLDTPGHALHHVCYRDEVTSHVFTGDALGIGYPDFDTRDAPFVFPGTTPSQFDPVAMHASIDLLMSYAPGAIYLTHFGQMTQVEQVAAQVRRLIDAFVAIAERHQGDRENRHAAICADLAELLFGEVRALGSTLTSERILALLAHDIEINAQGLEVWLDRARTG